MLKINNIVKKYSNGDSDLIALDHVSCKIDQGEFVVILGPSGSGKSTLLNCISGLDKIDSGEIFYDEINITKLDDKNLTKFRRDNTAFIFQSYFLMPSLSVEGNIKMGANLTKNNIDINEIIEAVGLKGKEKTLPQHLSGGEQQRVSIARAISKNPKYLFCDEPTGALDEATGRNILKYLIKLQNEWKFTIVMVTHNANIANLATKIISVNSGKIIKIIENTPMSVDQIQW